MSSASFREEDRLLVAERNNKIPVFILGLGELEPSSHSRLWQFLKRLSYLTWHSLSVFLYCMVYLSCCSQVFPIMNLLWLFHYLQRILMLVIILILWRTQIYCFTFLLTNLEYFFSLYIFWNCKIFCFH